MDNFFLYGGNQTPDIIMGKYSSQGLNPEIAQTYRGTEALQRLSEIKVNKYELWFSNTINFIPYDGSPVFIVDVDGNLTHSGNLLTRGNSTTNGNSLVKGNLIVEKLLNVKDNVTFDKDVQISGELKMEKDLRVNKDIYITGRIFSTYFDRLLATLNEIATSSKTTADSTKQTVDKLIEDVNELKMAVAELKNK